jgi:hypothetical protein
MKSTIVSHTSTSTPSSDLTPTGQRCATSPLAGAVLGTCAQPPLSKTLPDITLVCTTGERGISVQDGITGLYEVGTAWLPTGSTC